MTDNFCAICEGKLGKKDSEHVCRTCFRKAREPKAVTVEISDQGAERLGIALAVGNFINWGLEKLVEGAGALGVKPPPTPKTAQEAREQETAARAKLAQISRKLRPKGRRRRRGPGRTEGENR